MEIEKGNLELIETSEQPVLVDFYAEWCGPCLGMMPTVEAVASKLEGEVTVVKIDVDHHLDLVKKYKIMGVPTLILFQAGEIKWKQPGVLSKEQILKAVGENL